MKSFTDVISIGQGAELAAEFIKEFALTKVKPIRSVYNQINGAIDAVELLHQIISRQEGELRDLKDQLRIMRGELDDMESVRQAYLKSDDYGECEDDKPSARPSALVGVRY